MKLFEVKFRPNDWTNDIRTKNVVAANVVKAMTEALKCTNPGAYVTHVSVLMENIKVAR